MADEIVKHIKSKTDAQVNSEYTSTEGKKKVYFPSDAYRIYATGRMMASRYEADLVWGGRNFSGDFGALDAALLPALGTSRCAFLPASRITVQYSTNGGSSWTDYGVSEQAKVGLFSGIGSGFTIGKNASSGVNLANLQLRIIINDTKGYLYTTLNKFIINVGTNGSTGCWCSIDAKTQANLAAGTDTWTNFANKVNISGWSGHNVINTSGFTTCGDASNTSHYAQVRFTFGCTGGTSGTYKGLGVYHIYCFGGVGWQTPSNMAKSGHLYTWDYAQNAVFPASVSASGFVKSNSSDSYVLLGGGGHKSLDDLRPVKVNGTAVQTSATLDFINGDGISITEGSPNNGSIKIAADIKKVNAISFTAPSTPTVANYKTTLASIFNYTPYCVGRNVTVSDQLVYHWGEDSYTVQPSSVFQMTEIGGYSSNTDYGQWLLSSYGDRRLGVVGRASGSWTGMKWLAFTSDIPTSLPASDVYAWAKKSTLSIAINTLGEGTANATRNDFVVVQSSGGGTSDTGYYRRPLSKLFAALNSSDITTALGYTPPQTDTKNTTGATSDTTNKLFLIGAKGQGTNPQTYSNDNCYIGTDGCLYSKGNKVVATAEDVKSKLGIENTSTGLFLRKDGQWVTPGIVGISINGGSYSSGTNGNFDLSVIKGTTIEVGSSSTHKSYNADDYTSKNTLYTSSGDVNPSYTDAWSNFPKASAPSGGFFLLNILEGAYNKQIYSDYSNSDLYVRQQSYRSNPARKVWSTWAKIALMSDITWSNVQGSPNVAVQGEANNLIVYGNEFNFVANEYSGDVYFNYRTKGGLNGAISKYIFCDGAGHQLGYAIHSGNIGSQSVNYASSAGSVAWGNISGKPSSFTPSAHTHTMSNVTDLPDWVKTTDTKIPSSKLPSYVDDVIEVDHVIEKVEGSTHRWLKPDTPASELAKDIVGDEYNLVPDTTIKYFVQGYNSGTSNRMLVEFSPAGSATILNGESGKLYIDTYTNTTYRWNGYLAEILPNTHTHAWSNITGRYDTLLSFSSAAPSLAGSVSPIGMALSQEHSANRLAFLNPAAVSIEYSTDGESWTQLNFADSSKQALVTKSTTLPIGKASTSEEVVVGSKTRVTLTGTNASGTQYFYCSPKKLLIQASTANSMEVLIEYRNGTNTINDGDWTTYGTYALSGWSGWNDIPLVLGRLGGGSTQTSNNWQLRLTFVNKSKSTSYPTYSSIYSIRLFADNGWLTPSTMASTGHLYDFNIDKRAFFPEYVSASGFIKTNSSDNYVLLGGGGHKAVSDFTDTKVTQTVTSSANTSPRPLLIGNSYSDASTFAPATTTASAYATHLAKFAPSTGILSVVGLTKMNTNGTMATGSASKVWNTNGGVSDLPTVNNATLKIQRNGIDIATFTANSSTNATANISVPNPHPNLVKSTTSCGRLQEKWAVTDSHTPNECNIYEVVSAIESDGKLTNVSGKAIYLLDARVISWKGKSIPVSAARDGKTKKWKITIPSDYTSSTITNCYCYVKFVYDTASSGSPSVNS